MNRVRRMANFHNYKLEAFNISAPSNLRLELSCDFIVASHSTVIVDVGR
jgi:hypothetical protein